MAGPNDKKAAAAAAAAKGGKKGPEKGICIKLTLRIDTWRITTCRRRKYATTSTLAKRAQELHEKQERDKQIQKNRDVVELVLNEVR